MTSERASWLLTWLLRLAGAVLCFGALASLLPLEWMRQIHSKIGLGEMPSGRVVEYLARSAGLVYAMHGVIMLAVASDVRRYCVLVAWMGVLHVAFGTAMLLLDLYVGMPWHWTLGEGPPVVGVGLVILWLNQKTSRL